MQVQCMQSRGKGLPPSSVSSNARKMVACNINNYTRIERYNLLVFELSKLSGSFRKGFVSSFLF